MTATGPAPGDVARSDDAWFDAWRARELSRLDRDACYVDYTGAALFAESLLHGDVARLTTTVLGNPHSESDASRQATRDLVRAREALLDFVGADPYEYTAILTANASAACRLVGEAFPFGPDAGLVLSADNHNSVNGIREFAARRGGEIDTMPLDDELRVHDAVETLVRARRQGTGLFAFPAQSNFSGVRHPLSLIGEAHQRGFRVLLDAAAFVPTARLDLGACRADFVALSVYKIAGYPTGIGALIARHDALAELDRPWFAGGTVDWVSVTPPRRKLRAGSEKFEDGTPPFLAAGAVRLALAVVRDAQANGLTRHLSALTDQLLDALGRLRHGNGVALVTLHGPAVNVERGAAFAFTLRNAANDVIPYWDVETDARAAGIALRGGCFCNPGAAEKAFGLRDAVAWLEEIGDDYSVTKLSEHLDGQAVGALRVSLGLGSTRADVERVVGFLRGYLEEQ